MILAYDVTDRTAHVAWQGNDGVTHLREVSDGKATGFLLPLLQDVEQQSGETITSLGVVTGPGSFTGIRVGLATALGLRAARPMPVFGFTKPDLVAGLLENQSLLLPAGRGQALCIAFHKGSAAGEPQILPHDQLGPAENYRAITPITGFDCELLQINTAERCLQLIQAGAQEGRHPPEPYYVRPADAIAGRSLIDKLLNL